jgi:hypothetical protein
MSLQPADRSRPAVADIAERLLVCQIQCYESLDAITQSAFPLRWCENEVCKPDCFFKGPKWLAIP